ncbi:MAG: S9 family peptidase [Parvularcula sp.]|nr:S9 family peptidase [Parvularcula sp.]
MKTMITGALALAVGLVPAYAQDEAETPRDDLFTAARVFDLEYAANPQISPGGRRIVYERRSMDIETDRSVSNLWLLDLDEGTHTPLLDRDTTGSSARWSPDGSRIAFLSSRAGGKPDLKVHILDSDRTYSLAQLQEGTSVPVWSPDGQQLAFSMLVPDRQENFIKLPPKPEGAEWAPPIRVFTDLTYRADGRGYLTPGDRQLFTLPVDGGTPRKITDMPGGLSDVTWLDDETLLAVGNPDEDRDLQSAISQIFRVPLDGGEPEALTGRDGAASSPAVDRRGRMIAYLFQPDGEETYQQTELMVMDADGGDARSLTDDFDRSMGGITWHGSGQTILGLVGDKGLLRLVEFSMDGSNETLADDVGSQGVARPYASGSFSASARGDVAYTIAQNGYPSDVAYLRGRKKEVLTALNEDLFGEVTLAEVEKFEVPSSVGDYNIDAWVAFPPGYEKNGEAPLLLEIHGGPYSMYGNHFSGEVQRYAAEGYVTVFTNPRGSTGYGRDFAQEIDLAYPGEDYDDLISVVDFMIEEGYVSEDRLFVTGGSGGGVLTAWIVGNTDRFAAAASIKPVINWTSEALTADLASYANFEWLREFPWENQELYWKLSPLSKVGNVTTPTMLMAGEEDFRTPAWEAEQFFTALKLQGVDTMVIRVPGASHYIARRPSHLIAKTEAIMAWFERYDEKAGGEGTAESEDE